MTDYQYVSGIKEYKLLYWSHGLKLEAYLTEPSQPGKYPLLVNLHGGYVWQTKGNSSLGYSAQAAASLAFPETVTLYPEYEGYMESQGTLHGLQSDTLDVRNAITAAESLNEVAPNDLYLIGYSAGGGIALMTAATDKNVKAVVAVSPFVGLHDFASWAIAHAKPGSSFSQQLQLIENSYGTDIHSQAYNVRSPDIASIQAPVLLLQGTTDHHVAWQTVERFDQQMKNAHKTVKLVLYPGGHHGLHQANGLASSDQIHNWFMKYGLSNGF